MPFDGTDFASPAPKGRNEILAELSAVLRDRSRWPVGFEWSYTRETTCAVGMGRELFGVSAFEKAAKGRCVPFTSMFRIFVWGAGTGLYSQVQPEQVADAIDRHLARKGHAVERVRQSA